MTSEQLLKVMKTQPGQIYNAQTLAADARGDRGSLPVQGLHSRHRRQPEDERHRCAHARYRRGRDRVHQNHGQHPHQDVCHPPLHQDPRRRDLQRTRRLRGDVGRLNALGWFETVRRDAEIGSEPGKVVVIFTVVEKKRSGMVSVGGGYSSVQGLVGFVDLTKANLGGNGQQASIRGEFGGRAELRARLSAPVGDDAGDSAERGHIRSVDLAARRSSPMPRANARTSSTMNGAAAAMSRLAGPSPTTPPSSWDCAWMTSPSPPSRRSSSSS